jgi:hypothetical protein
MRLPNGIFTLFTEGCLRLTLVVGIYSSGKVPRGRAPSPCPDHRCPIHPIYAGG